MKALCQGDSICPQCGIPLIPKVKRTCAAFLHNRPLVAGDGPVALTEPPQWLGDRVEALLKSVGITQELVGEVLADIGLPDSCGGCNSRKEWLNKAHKWLTARLARLGGHV